MTLPVLNSFKLLFFLTVSIIMIHRVASQDEDDAADKILIIHSEETIEDVENSEEDSSDETGEDTEEDSSDETGEDTEEDSSDETGEDTEEDSSDEFIPSGKEVSHSESVDKTSFTDKYRDYENNDENLNPAAPLRLPQCGNSIDIQSRILDGDSAKVGTWTWIAVLGYQSDHLDVDTFICGASLISSRHVLTAAHCVYDKEGPFIIRLGEHDLSNDDDDNAIDILVQEVTVHSDYNDVTKENDIAILKLAQEVEFTDDIYPICLPIEDDVKNRNFVGDYLFAAGWGATSNGGPSSDTLLEIQMPVVDEETCYDYFKNNDEVSFVVDDRVVCAGYEEGGADTCQGDSGGPLVFSQHQNQYLIGVVSVGYYCGRPNNPGLYTRVTSFLDFILSNMN